MRRPLPRRITRSRVAAVCCAGLIGFGVVDASFPHPTLPSAAVPGLGAPRSPGHHMAVAGTKPMTGVPLRSRADTAAQRVAERFVVATDTTDPNRPEGDGAERALLAPGLAVPRQLAWPEAWVAEDRKTTVVLDPPGPAVTVGTGQVAVVVTGRTIVTTDVGPSAEVPVDERITLRLIEPPGTATPNGTASPSGTASLDEAAHWVVTDVGTGS